MTRREQVLTLIRCEIAQEGKITAYALRLYVEGRISRQAFNDAVDRGMKQWYKAYTTETEKHLAELRKYGNGVDY